jgi:transcription-repair coupling factor (superfamily II helicase)
MQDILDEFIDRFGEPPRETLALLKISLIRALGVKHSISKIEERSSSVIFLSDKPSLDIWSEIFGLHKGLSFKPMGAEMAVVYKLVGGESAVEGALKLLLLYDETETKNKKENENAE